jgi:glycyl-tRNA synthetase beta subunit
MTPSKLWYAQKLATLRGDGSKPEELAEQMTIRRLCYEIEKIEEQQAEAEAEDEVPEVEEVLANEKKAKKTKPKSFWARIALDSSSEEDEEE